ncbi:MAG: hypothetical protein SWY16_11140 [Cyanobacteriota bacterium]|nr:hypothetical protein [Cyanobacteriota bacterium]
MYNATRVADFLFAKHNHLEQAVAKNSSNDSKPRQSARGKNVKIVGRDEKNHTEKNHTEKNHTEKNHTEKNHTNVSVFSGNFFSIVFIVSLGAVLFLGMRIDKRGLEFKFFNPESPSQSSESSTSD